MRDASIFSVSEPTTRIGRSHYTCRRCHKELAAMDRYRPSVARKGIDTFASIEQICIGGYHRTRKRGHKELAEMDRGQPSIARKGIDTFASIE